jgi:hypothetical protein
MTNNKKINMKKEIILKKFLVLKDQLESNPWQYGWIIEIIEEVEDVLNEQEEKSTEMTNNKQQIKPFWKGFWMGWMSFYLLLKLIEAL